MANDYSVRYNISVQGAETAAQALQRFQTAANELAGAAKSLNSFQGTLNKTIKAFNQLRNAKKVTLDMNTTSLRKKLDTLITKLNTIEKKSASIAGIMLGTPLAPAATGGTTTTPKRGNSKTQTNTSKNVTPVRQNTNDVRANLRRANSDLFGPPRIGTYSGIGIVDMFKGMGIAYGITGLGTLMRRIVDESTEYNNIITTTRNILQSHDKDFNFEKRFSDMESTIRQVGVETKFTAPQVADASRFLAMAGLNIADINDAIRPIADIALVGDTDLGKTADVVTNIMTGYGIAAEDMRSAADVMTNTFTMSNTTLMEIAESYKYSSALLSSAGVSFETSAAAIGVLGDAGIKSSQAGTTMRTILTNILNPTSKQAKTWRAIGVERFDKNGELRELPDIFMDLKRRGVEVEDFFKLFHRTAVQGAVALTNHVDKWNDIIIENFLSDGITARLADAKKNTIQGLWAQITSQMTENGLKVFEEFDGRIREMMGGVLSILQQPGSVDFIRNIAGDLLQIIEYAKKFTGTIIKLYQQFRPLILLWLKAQLMAQRFLLPLNVLRKFRSVFKSFGAYLTAGHVWFLKYKTIFKGLPQLTRDVRLFAGAFLGKGISADQQIHLAGVFGRTSEQQSAMLDANYFKNQRLLVAKYAGGVLGYKLGSKIGKEGTWLNMTSSLVGAGAGAVAGAQAMKWAGKGLSALFGKLGPLKAILGKLGTILKFVASGPWGWIAGAVVVISAATFAIIKHHKAMVKAAEAAKVYHNSVVSINGISLTKNASAEEKRLAIIYNRQLSVNGALSEHIRLMKEEMGIEDIRNKMNNANITIPEDIMNALNGNIKGVKYAFKHGYVPGFDGVSGDNESKLSTINGISYKKKKREQLAIGITAASLARNAFTGNPFIEERDQFVSQILKSESLEDIAAIMTQIDDATNKLKESVIPESEKWSIEDWEKATDNEKLRSYHAVYTGIDMLNALKDYQSADSINGNFAALQVQAYARLLAEDKQGSVSNETLYNYLSRKGVGLFDRTKFAALDDPELLRQVHYWDNVFHPFVDDNGIERTSAEARGNIVGYYKELQEAVSVLPEDIQKYFEPILQSPFWDMAKKTNRIKANPTLDAMDDLDGIASNYGTDGMPDYSLSKDSSAQPRQVIVNIENLMNVESIDMTNSNNAAVIASVKEQLVEALIDVVHDFDESWNG